MTPNTHETQIQANTLDLLKHMGLHLHLSRRDGTA